MSIIAKLDDLATRGLLGTPNSLAYRVHEIDRHFHSYERWLGKAVTPSATHFANRIGKTESGGSEVALQIDAGDDDWGTWTQIMGSSDTPVVAGNVYFDLHRILVYATEHTTQLYFLQFAAGVDGATAITNNTFCSIPYRSTAVNQDKGSIFIQMRRVAAGTNIWARSFAPGKSTSTIDFWIGLHEYEG